MIETVTSVLSYLANNKIIIVGAVGTVSEVTVILYNMWRQIKKIRNSTLKDFHESTAPKRSFLRMLVWAANPFNIKKEP